MTSGASGLVDTAVGALGGVLNYNNDKKLADYQYSKQLEQWNRENEYNSPVEQRKRLAAAGLNPNLVYGGGATTLSARSPSYEAPKSNINLNSPDILGKYQQMKMQDVQTGKIEQEIELLNASTANKNADTSNKLLESQGIITTNAQKEENLNQSKQMNPEKLEQIRLTNKHEKEQIYNAIRDGRIKVQTLKTMKNQLEQAMENGALDRAKARQILENLSLDAGIKQLLSAKLTKGNMSSDDLDPSSILSFIKTFIP